MSDIDSNKMFEAAEHIRRVREAEEIITMQDQREREKNEEIRLFIAHEIRLAMQQEKLSPITNGVDRAAVADIRAQMIMIAINSDSFDHHVMEIPADQIAEKTKDLLSK